MSINEKETDLREALDYINPAALSYNDWLRVGMGLKEAGYPASMWEDWSARDPRRYHSGECLRKWESFRDENGGPPVTGATVAKMAMDNGWKPYRTRDFTGSDEGLDWNAVIGGEETADSVFLDPERVEPRTLEEPSDSQWRPVREIVRYLDTLFKPTDYVGYVTESFEKEGKYFPKKGSYDRTAEQLIVELEKCDGDIGAVLGDYNENAGAWIRFNPVDGKGIGNKNVAAFRYALVESDKTDLEMQNALIRELELPVACLVYSGGKSLHAIVRVDAKDDAEYNRRVNYLYDICEKNGLEVDRQNKNPARLSRMPGIWRNGHKQYLIATNIGKANWSDWVEWVESVNDDLPDIEGDIETEVPELSPPLIADVLRQGHKMLLAGPSKAGKSYALIELCISIAEGLSWLGFPCSQGKVMYVNLELDRASCLNRFRDVRSAMGAPSRHSVDIWNLRGHSIPMDKLAPKLIRRAKKKNYLAIVIDPIYKVITGDENSADQMARFCNQFDKVCTELDCAVIYCHHHSKGIQGGKRSMDRASGSGVFARDPDALLDLIELPVSDSLRKQEINNAVRRVCVAALKSAGKLVEVSQDDLCSENAALTACEGVLTADEYDNLLTAASDAKRAAEARTAWRIEGTLREFPKFTPVNLWFDYPIHLNDESGVLSDIDPETPSIQKATEKRKKSAKEKRNDRKRKLEDAIANANMGEPPTVKDITEYLSTDTDEISERTVRNWLKEFGYAINKNAGNVVTKTNEEADSED